MVTDYPFDRPKKVIDNEKKRITKPLTPQSGFVVRDLIVVAKGLKWAWKENISKGNYTLRSRTTNPLWGVKDFANRFFRYR